MPKRSPTVSAKFAMLVSWTACGWTERDNLMGMTMDPGRPANPTGSTEAKNSELKLWATIWWPTFVSIGNQVRKITGS